MLLSAGATKSRRKCHHLHFLIQALEMFLGNCFLRKWTNLHTHMDRYNCLLNIKWIPATESSYHLVQN